MSLRIGINGFGRIGRNVFRIMARSAEAFEVVGINDLCRRPLWHSFFLVSEKECHKGRRQSLKGGRQVSTSKKP